MPKDNTPEIKYVIEKSLGKLSEKNKGWIKEVNLVSWNGQEAKVDIRDWNEDHSKMGRGITLTTSEAETLAEILKEKL